MLKTLNILIISLLLISLVQANDQNDSSKLNLQKVIVAQTELPTIENIKGKRIVKDGKIYIRVSWDLSDEHWNDKIEKYFLYRSKSKHSSMALISKINNNGKRTADIIAHYHDPKDYRIGISVLMKNGKIGKISSRLFENIKGFYVPKPTQPGFFEISKHQTYATIYWRMTKKVDYLKGYKIYRKRMGQGNYKTELIADETLVDAKTSKYRVGPHQPGVNYEYWVSAVSVDGFNSAESRGAIYKNRKGKYKINHLPESLSAFFNKEDNTIHLSWKYNNDSMDLVEHFEVTVDKKDAINTKIAHFTKDKSLKLTVNKTFSGKLKLSVNLIDVYDATIIQGPDIYIDIPLVK